MMPTPLNVFFTVAELFDFIRAFSFFVAMLCFTSCTVAMFIWFTRLAFHLCGHFYFLCQFMQYITLDIIMHKIATFFTLKQSGFTQDFQVLRYCGFG